MSVGRNYAAVCILLAGVAPSLDPFPPPSYVATPDTFFCVEPFNKLRTGDADLRF